MAGIKFKIKTGSSFIDKYGTTHPEAIISPIEVKNNTYSKQLSVIFAIFHNQDAYNNNRPPLDRFQAFVSMNTNAPSKDVNGNDVHIKPTTDLSTVVKLGYPDYNDFWNFFDLSENGLELTHPIGLYWLLHTTDLVTPNNLELPLITYWDAIQS